MRDTTIFVFETFRLDLRDERLWRGEEAVCLTHKAFLVLRCLLEHPGQLVTKDELLDAVWSDTVVSEAAMTVCIRELRQALGDDARAPRFIETVRGRGYRFLAPVTTLDRSDALRPAAAPERPTKVPAPGTSPSWLRPPVSLVGRAAELARLHEWFAAAKAGQRRVGFIVGEVGIGKTTLVDAFVVQAGGEDVPWLGHGQCVDQYGSGEAYLPLLEALGRLCRGPGGERLLVLLRQHAPSWLAQMPALIPEGEREALRRAEGGVTQARMLRELAEAVEILTTEHPLILVLEDLHWGDASTVAWLGYVARRREPARLLVLGTYRPVAAIVTAQPLRALAHELRGRGQAEELLLDYLSEASVEAYLAERCPGYELPAGLARVLHQRTDGNPLFLVTMVDTLVRQGELAEGPEGWHLPGGLGAVTEGVPENLRQLIEHHLEQVDPEEQAILAAAGVAGAEFSAAAVAAGVESGAEAVEAHCEALARRRLFLEARGIAAWPDGTVTGRYGFLHALYPKVLYDRVPAGRRAQMHRRIGLALEAGYGGRSPEIAAELAEHFVRGGDRARAVRYLLCAGENALHKSAHQEAVAHVTRGLDVLAALPDTVERARQELDLQTLLGLTFMAAKGYAAPEVESAFGRARVLCQELGPSAQLVPVLRGLWGYHLARAELHRAREAAEQLLRLGQASQDPMVLGSAHHGLGQILFNLGEFSAAQEHLEQAYALFARQRLSSADAIRAIQDGRVVSLGTMAFCLWHLGYPDRALQRSQEALALARELGHPFTLAYALFFVAFTHSYRGEYASLHQHNEEMLALSEEQGFPLFVLAGSLARSALLTRQGQLAVGEGIAQISRIADAFRATGAAGGFPKLLAVLVEMQRDADQLDEAFASLAEAQAAVERTSERRYEAELSLLEGSLHLAKEGRGRDVESPGERVEQAEACFRRAIEVARRQEAKSLELQAATSLGRLWQRQGRREEARELLGPVYGWFTEGFDTADLKAAKALLGELAG